MKRLLTLLAALACSTATPESTSQTEVAFGEWSVPARVTSLNTSSNDMYAVLSRDELTVYFTSDRSGNMDLWFAARESTEDPWSAPANMGATINTGFVESLPVLSYDEHVMFFHSTRDGGCGPSVTTGDIWMTRRRDARSQEWEPPTNLGCMLNTTATEIAPAFFEHPETGQITLFYGSNRFKTNPNDYDVYASNMGEDGYFGPGALVPEFSSDRRDTRIFIRRDGLEAFVTSDRSGTLDIWTSTRESLSDQWTVPLVDLPSPVNSACEDGSPWLSRDGTTLYFFSSRADSGCGTRDIWYTTRPKIKQENSTDTTNDGIRRRILDRVKQSSPDRTDELRIGR